MLALLPFLLLPRLQLAASLAASLQTIYVAPNGSDVTGTGRSPATALASCAGAVRTLSADRALAAAGGVQVVFLSGTYPLNANVRNISLFLCAIFRRRAAAHTALRCRQQLALQLVWWPLRYGSYITLDAARAAAGSAALGSISTWIRAADRFGVRARFDIGE